MNKQKPTVAIEDTIKYKMEQIDIFNDAFKINGDKTLLLVIKNLESQIKKLYEELYEKNF